MLVHRLSFPLLSFFVFLAGCSSQGKLETTVVTGTVKVDGQPMEGVTVTFCPTAPDENPAVGSTDTNGVFTLTTPGGVFGKGAIPGSYIPTFSKIEVEKFEAASREEYEKKYGNREPKTVHLLPTKYADSQTCGFEPVTVEKGKKNQFDFELKSK